MAFEKIINIVVNTVGFDKAKVEIEANKKALDTLTDAQVTYNNQINKTKEEIKKLEAQRKKNNKLTQDEQKQLDSLNKQLILQQDGLKKNKKERDSYIKTLEDSEKSTKDLDKAQKDAGKSGGLLTKVTKGFGTALKGLGIGAIVAVLALLTNALMKNQRIMDFFSKVTNAVGIVVEKLFDILEQTVDAIEEANMSFDSTKAVISSLLKIALKPLQLSFNAIKLGVLKAQLAWEDSFFGKGDEGRIEELKEGIKETKDTIVELGKEAFEAGKDLITNFKGAYDEISGAGKIFLDTAKENASEFKTVWKEAGDLTNIQNNFDMLSAQQQRLATQYQNQAEDLKQIRNDENKSISDRIKANEDLIKVLDKQIEAEQNAIKLKIQGLKEETRLKGRTEDLDLAIFQLQTELEQVELRANKAKTNALRQQNTLKNQSIQLAQLELDAEQEREIDRLKFIERNSKSEQEALNARQERLQLERQIQEDKFQRELEQYEEGTKARIEAEQAWLDAKQELDQQELLLEQDKEARRKEILGLDGDEDLSPADKLRAEKEDELEVLKEALDNELISYEEYVQRKKEIDQSYLDNVQALAEEEKRINAEKASSNIQQAQQYLGAVSSLTSSFLSMMEADEDATEEEKEKRNKRKFKIEKALKMGEVALATALGISNAVAQSPMTGGLPGSAIAGATGIAQLAAIASTKYESPNIDTDVNQGEGDLEETISPDVSMFEGQEDAVDRSTTDLSSPRNQTIRAVVVESDIIDTSDRLNNIENGSEL